MSELGTIDDLTSWTCSCNCITFDNKVCRSCGLPAKYGEIDYEELKQEAINWIKNCNNPVDFTRSDRCGKALDRFPYCYCDECQRFIKFFNLTEEDLE